MSETTEQLVSTIVEALQDKKGRQIVVANLEVIPDTICKRFVLCTGGSPTQVKRIFPPEAHVEHVHLEGDDAAKAAQLADLLEARKFLQ